MKVTDEVKKLRRALARRTKERGEWRETAESAWKRTQQHADEDVGNNLRYLQPLEHPGADRTEQDRQGDGQHDIELESHGVSFSGSTDGDRTPGRESVDGATTKVFR